MKIKIYKTLIEAMSALANKKDQPIWKINRNENGWYYLERRVTL